MVVRECLQFLRLHVSEEGGVLDLVGDKLYQIGKQNFAASEPSGLRSSRDQSEYTLQAIVLLVDLRTRKQSEYVSACASRGAKPVVITDKADVLGYLDGKLESCKQLVHVDEAVAVAKPPASASASSSSSSSSSAAAAAAAAAELPLLEGGGGGAAVAAAPPPGGDNHLDTTRGINAAANEEEEAEEEDVCVSYDGEYVNDRMTSITIPGADFSFAIELYDRFRQRKAAEEKHKRETPKHHHHPKGSSEHGKNKPSAAATTTTTTTTTTTKDAKRRRTTTTTTTGEPTTSSLQPPLKKAAFKKQQEQPPRIIVVPNAMTSTLSLINAAEFLEHGKFLTTSERKLAEGYKKESSVIIRRTRADGTTTSYRIIDNPTRLKEGEWSRVTAVFAQGPIWQFKGWPMSKPVDIFSKVLGFNLHFDDEKTDENIKNWNVHVLKISKTKRHLDEPVQLAFWRFFDDFVEKGGGDNRR